MIFIPDKNRIQNKFTYLANFTGYPGLLTWLSDLWCADVYAIFTYIFPGGATRISRGVSGSSKNSHN